MRLDHQEENVGTVEVLVVQVVEEDLVEGGSLGRQVSTLLMYCFFLCMFFPVTVMMAF